MLKKLAVWSGLALGLATLCARAELPDFNKDPNASGKFTPVQIAFATPIQFFPSTWDVAGLRLDLIYGNNHNVGFVDVGLVNVTRDRQTGVQVGGLLNLVQGEMSGIQVGGILNTAGDTSVMQGLQVSCVNVAGDASGLQVGVFNRTNTVQGMQIGVINVAEELDGLQIGLVNCNTKGAVPFMPILNFGF